MEKEITQILKEIQSGRLDPQQGLFEMDELKKKLEYETASSLLFMNHEWVSEDRTTCCKLPHDIFTIIFAECEEDWNFVEDAIIVTRGDTCKKIDSRRYVLNPAKEEDYEFLFAQLGRNQGEAIRILHLWSTRIWRNDRETMEQQLDESFYSVFYLCKALRKVRGKIVLTYGYLSEDGKAQPLYAAMSGFLKTVMLEQTSITAKIAGMLETTRQQACKLLWEESTYTETQTEILFQGAKRVVKQMKECTLLDGTSEYRLKRNGTYLITGGLGGIGFIFASYLAKEWKANLVLVGLHEANQVKLEMLEKIGCRVIYIKMDIADEKDIEALFHKAESHFGKVDGILHAAGMVKDCYLSQKNMRDIKAVFAPKIYGTMALMQYADALDFFVMFSAGAGLTGNIGQCDYAFANCFMDELSSLATNSNKIGRVVSINWPLWQDGGMQVSDEVKKQMEQRSGMLPLRTESGIKAFLQILNGEQRQVLVAEGDRERMKQLFCKEKEPTKTVKKKVVKKEPIDVLQQVQKKMAEMISQLLKIEENVIDMDADFVEFGFDSISFTKFSNLIHETYNIDIMPSIFFDFLNTADLSEYLVEEYADEINAYYQQDDCLEEENIEEKEEDTLWESESVIESSDHKSYFDDVADFEPDRSDVERVKKGSSQDTTNEPIAVIGISAVMPQSDNASQYWNNIVSGKDMISEIPKERWDWQDYYGDPVTEEGKTNIKWGGFMNGIRAFDASFFGIPAVEAEYMDPQQRIFMENVWHVIEDAGYKASDIAGTKTSLFVGVASIDYNQLMQTAKTGVQSYSATGVSHSVLANRLSFLLDIHGQSEPVDTACSSSLIAVHQAMESIRHGGCEMAIAGGVNVISCPDVYISFSKAGMLSPTGACKTFDDSADGYVRGEGCGAILLKPLKKAIEDNDHIYGVLLGSAVNHGGHAANLTAPNPNAQAQVVLNAWKNAGIDPFTISYIEAHGTGTKLGDPVEIEGLKKAYAIAAKEQERSLPDGDNCKIGAVKTQIGHLETAAGIASVIKVLLSLKNKKLAGNLHFKKLNSFISLKDAPFSVLSGTELWNRKIDANGEEIKRRAGISCFGFGGANAHLVLEEYCSPKLESGNRKKPNLLVLSAKTQESLYCYINQIAEFLESTEESFEDILYTLRVGREEMKERIAIVAESKEQARKLLLELYEGERELSFVAYDEENMEKDEQFTRLMKAAKDWMDGKSLTDCSCFLEQEGRRCSVPGYPFERKEFWIPMKKKVDSFLAKPMYFTQSWEKKDIEDENNTQNDIALIFGNSLLGKEVLGNGVSETVFVGSGSHFEKVSLWEYKINPFSYDDYMALTEELYRDGMLPDKILYGWLLQEMEQEREVERMFTFLKALTQYPEKRTELLVFYENGNGINRPKIRPFTALLRTLMHENNQFAPRLVEVDNASYVQVAVQKEIRQCAQRDIDVRYVNGDRYVRIIEQMESSQAQQPREGTGLRRRGTYLLTGGMGGIGKLLVDYLVRTEQADVILLGRSKESPDFQQIKHRLHQYGSLIQYIQCDITQSEDVRYVIQKVNEQYGTIDGVFHCAGIHNDLLLKYKTYENFCQVIEPKTKGLQSMISVANATNAKFIFCFSSVVGIYGNQGQIDYAYANSFLNEQVLEGVKDCRARLISVSWPLWEDGGMMPDETIILKNQENGIYCLPSSEAMGIVEEVLLGTEKEYIVGYGEPKAKEIMLSQYLQYPGEAFVEKKDLYDENESEVQVREEETEQGIEQQVRVQVQEFLCNLFAKMLGIKQEEVELETSFQDYGVDSLIVNQFNVTMSSYIGNLSKTLLFEYNTIKALADYLVNTQKDKLMEMFDIRVSEEPQKKVLKQTERKQNVERDSICNVYETRQVHNTRESLCDIAIIGMSGRYPGSSSLDEFWENLSAGKDLVTEIPKERWDINEYYDADPNHAVNGKMYCRMGGFLERADDFDPLFFGISKRDAELIDPQERIFMETAWSTFEDAGYSKERIRKLCESDGKEAVGVFVGMTTHTYALWGPEECQKGNNITPNLATWSAANRISYMMNLNGPSMTVDTACSSSLTAIHLACESIARGESKMALAGGVNLYLHPSKYVTLSIARMLSPTGKCHSFGKDSDGFVPGEGVGAFLLKPLNQALKDRDHIYAVIKATAINHGGTTNGYTVPNPNMQADLIMDAMKRGRIVPESVSYIEAHGTGTALGDPIEISGLTKAFAMDHVESPFCAVGSVKSNIGHLEAAAGVASLTKVVLQMQHKKLVPSLHSRELNPNLILEDTPFYIQQELEDWRCGTGKRRAGISAFGAGGTNVHVIVEEYESANTPVTLERKENVILVSAKNPERLRNYVENLYAFLEQKERENLYVDLDSLAYTLQIGREAMEERIAFTASSIHDCKEKLGLYLKNPESSQIAHNNVKKAKSSLFQIVKGEEGIRFIKELVAKHKMDNLAQLWVEGIEIEWEQLYSRKVETISLPTYPFKKEAFFVKRTKGCIPSMIPTGKKQSYSMIENNRSTFAKQCYEHVVDGTEFYLRDHVLGGQRILPGACYIEIARQAGCAAAEKPVTGLRNVLWAKPVVVGTAKERVMISLEQHGEQVSYEVGTQSNGAISLHSQGTLVYDILVKKRPEPIAVEQIIARCTNQISGGECYQQYKQIAFAYGPSMQGIEMLYTGNGEAISKITLPEEVKDSLDVMKLQPSIMDAAFQTVTGVMDKDNTAHAAFLPFSMGELTIHQALQRECYAYVKQSENNQNNRYLKKFDIFLTDRNGNVLVVVQSFCVKALQNDKEKITVMAPQQNERVNDVKFHKMNFVNSELTVSSPVSTEEVICLVSDEISKEYTFGMQEYVYKPAQRTYEEWRDFFEGRIAECEPVALIWITKKESVADYNVDVDNQIERMILDNFRICKALQETWMKHRIGSHITLIQVVAGESSGCMQSACAAFGRTLEAENPKFSYKLLDWDGYQVSEFGKLILKEAGCKENDSEVRYRNGCRQVKCLAEVNMSNEPVRACTVRENGVYLITGGASGLGKIFAGHLAENAHVRLVLVGRSKENQIDKKGIEELTKAGAEVMYLSADVSNYHDVASVVQQIKQRWETVNGVIHCAGLVKDSYISKKTEESFCTVLQPKIKGMVWLDRVLRDEHLDFFVAFSSTAAVIGNPGQSDYACGNYFMNLYGKERKKLCQQGERSGETVVINWPLWKDGGMQVDEVTLQWLQKKSGTIPLSQADGLWAYEQIMNHDVDQLIVSQYVNGNLAENKVPKKEVITSHKTVQKVVRKQVVSQEELIKNCEKEVTRLCSEVLKVEEDEFDREEELINYGLDSIAMMTLINKMEEAFHSVIDANMLAEFTTIEALANHLIEEGIVKAEEEVIEEVVEEEIEKIAENDESNGMYGEIAEREENNVVYDEIVENAKEEKLDASIHHANLCDKIAVIGMACRFPQSEDIDQYWKNLKAGTDMVMEIPEDRWSIEKYYSEDRKQAGKSYSKWGGYIKGIYEFAADYFHVTDEDAVVMDPHHRILLELTDELFYRAGYQPKEMSGTKTDVIIGGGESNYVKNNMGKIPNEYMKHGLISTIPNMMAARIADFYNLKGCAKTIDTACSSSLVAIHEACQAIRSGECDMAIAGGIELLVDEQIHIAFSKAEVLAEDGKCKVFDENADGMVPGEGAGVVLLKSYDKAVEDGDNILGVILGSAVNNDGHTMGLTVPGIDGQYEVIKEAIRKSGISPRTIQYLETHGTGTLLGDPIEIRAAGKVYSEYTQDKQFCAVASVKSNIGHLMRAAGVASFIKNILSLRNKWIPKTLHCSKPHPRFRFEETPFYPELEGKKWITSTVRRAAVSSFGFGGTNCHIILEEYIEDRNAAIQRTPLPVPEMERKYYRFDNWIEDRKEILSILDEMEEGKIDLEEAERLINQSRI